MARIVKFCLLNPFYCVLQTQFISLYLLSLAEYEAYDLSSGFAIPKVCSSG